MRPQPVGAVKARISGPVRVRVTAVGAVALYSQV